MLCPIKQLNPYSLFMMIEFPTIDLLIAVLLMVGWALRKAMYGDVNVRLNTTKCHMLTFLLTFYIYGS